jgi:hypothetical protein
MNSADVTKSKSKTSKLFGKMPSMFKGKGEKNERKSTADPSDSLQDKSQNISRERIDE